MAKKKTEETKKLHGVFNDENLEYNAPAEHHKLINDHINSDNFTEEEYENLLTDKYENSGRIREKLLQSKAEREKGLKEDGDEDSKAELEAGTAYGALENHKLNNPELNAKILNNAPADVWSDLVQHLKLDTKTLKNIAKKQGGDASVSNRHITPDQFNEVIKSMTPENLASSTVLEHPMLKQEHANRLLNSSKTLDDNHAFILASRGMLNRHHAKKALDRAIANKNLDPEVKSTDYKDRFEKSTKLDALLDYLPDHEKKDYLDTILGIKGGSYKENPPDHTDYEQGKDDESYIEDNQAWHANNFMNWKRPGPVDSHTLMSALRSRHLSKDQQEHVMRHGSTLSKWDMLTNSNSVDPEIANKMWQKFHDEDDHHGYDMDKVKKQLKNDFQNDDEGIREEARDQAYDNYPMDEFLNDYNKIPTQRNIERNGPGQNESRYRKTYAFDAHEIADHIRDNPHKYNHVAPHPDDENKQINYFDQDSGEGHGFEPWEHPDWDEMAHQATEEKLREDGTPDHLYEHYDEVIDNDIWENGRIQDIIDDKVDNYLYDSNNFPTHLRGNMPALREHELDSRRGETNNAMDFSDINNPSEMSHTHEYSPGQHWHEMVKDHADANGGKIDIGSMNKKYPGLTHKWKEVFGDKGSISSEEAQKKIDSLPKKKYNISAVTWGKNNMQNINGQQQLVVRLDNSDDMYKELHKDPELYDVYRKVQESSRYSGHPSNWDTIGWTRIDTTDPKHWMIDEQQTDFDKALRNQIENSDGDQAKKDNILKQVDKVGNLNEGWREALMNYTVKLAKKNGVDKISTHSPESKASHTHADKVHSTYKEAYQQIPRSMGFRSVTADQLPLTDQGKEIFKKKGINYPSVSESERGGLTQLQYNVKRHKDAAIHHMQHAAASPEGSIKMKHKSLAAQHIDRAKQMDPTDTTIKDIGTEGSIPELDHSVKVFTPHASDAYLNETDTGEMHKGHTLDLTSDSMKMKKSDVDDFKETFRKLLFA